MNRRIRIALAVGLSGLIAASAAAQKPAAGAKRGAPAVAGKSQVVPEEAPAGVQPAARAVQVGATDVVEIQAKLRYTTLIVLPPQEKILDFTTGDKEFWVINGNQNLAYVKPAKAGSQTNLNLVTASGNIYSFVLTEVSGIPGGQPDLKVFVEPKDESMIASAQASPKFVSSEDVEGWRQQVELAREETRQAKAAAQAAIDAGVSKFITNVRFPYRFEAGKKPFYVRAMYHDDSFTYIQARPEETPTLYEIKDGQPNLINFDYKNGIYVVDKILDGGYLTIGKAKLHFAREE